MAAILEYLTAEILQAASDVSSSLNVKRITPRHLNLAVRGDHELDKLVRATIAGGGVVPGIPKALLETSMSEAKGTASRGGKGKGAGMAMGHTHSGMGHGTREREREREREDPQGGAGPVNAGSISVGGMGKAKGLMGDMGDMGGMP
ncbi:histone H2A [Kipferlia bialata]|uniref:Histone H2A n=1 Tax=Kipferlia bialata TaxID=797122 RepID=A0A9K3GKQ7_9EUKA|nr:histone H2A [Kipferlia bialata]|eukprot:g7497.t1